MSAHKTADDILRIAANLQKSLLVIKGTSVPDADIAPVWASPFALDNHEVTARVIGMKK